MKKKKTIIFVIVLAIVCSGIVVTAVGGVLSKRNILSLRESTALSYEEKNELFNDFIKSLEQQKNDKKSTNKKLKIPVFHGDDLLGPMGYCIGSDAAWVYHYDSRPNDTREILTVIPTSAIRLTEGGTAYTVCDTDTGFRLFIYYDKELDYNQTVGYPVLIDKMLDSSDFSGLKVGDPIASVEAVDSVITVYKEHYSDIDYIKKYQKDKLEKAPETVSFWENGVLCSKEIQPSQSADFPVSLHYLNDGLLKILYEAPENAESVNDLVISRIDLYENYVMPDSKGAMIDYTINKLDLPKK